MMFKIYAPSYQRAESAFTHKTYPEVFYVVAESEAAEYRKVHDRVVAVPDKVQGLLPRVYNWILKNADVENLVITDDDISCYGYFWEKKECKLSQEGLNSFIEHGFLLAEDLGAYFWGLNINDDRQSYREYTPFSMLSYIGGPFQAHRRSHGIFYDLKMFLKEDYDMTLMQINKFRRVLRFNGYYYRAKQGGSGSGQAGGCASYRNVKVEIEQVKALQRKWGNQIVKFDPREGSRSNRTDKKQNFDVNPIIKVPIKGV